MANLRDAMYGLAVGDALGVPVEFKRRGSYHIEGMISGGTYGMPAGTWSDDTSMALATCDSIRLQGKIDPKDIAKSFKDWLYRGKYTADGHVFDVGNTVSRALDQGYGCGDERSNGNGSLMRILPLAFVEGVSEDEIREVSAITHAHPISTEGCVLYIQIATDLLKGSSIKEALGAMPKSGAYSRLRTIDTLDLSEIRSSGYVVDTLEAALWALSNTSSYQECVLACANMGDDTDTVAAVAGGLAGIIYGYDAIPAEWIDALQGKDVIESCLFSKPGEDLADQLSRGERNAVTMWTMGLGDMNKTMNGESPLPDKKQIALKSSWETHRMPRHRHTTIECEFPLTEEELTVLAKGHIPEVMEDHWFMYFDGEFINYYRSWTGYCIYRGRVERVNGEPVINKLYVNRNPEQYKETSDKKDELLFYMLVAAELGQDTSILWEQIFELDS